MKKIGFLVLTIILVLGGMGIGYSMWWQNITVSGTVNTGNVVVGIRDGFNPGYSYPNSDPPPNGIIGKIFPANSSQGTVDPRVVPFTTPPPVGSSIQALLPYVPANQVDKNVASMDTPFNNSSLYGTYLFTGNNGNSKFYSSITENITNAYPFYAPQTFFVISSNSSVPVKIDGFNLSDPNNILGTVLFYWQINNPNDGIHYGYGSISDLATALHGIQLEQGQQLYVTIDIVFLESTPQGASGSFTLSITGAQWNEVT